MGRRSVVAVAIGVGVVLGAPWPPAPPAPAVARTGEAPRGPAVVAPDDRDQPSAAVGSRARTETPRRVIGLPATVALVIGAAVVLLFIVAGLVIRRPPRHDEARGGGSY